MTDDMHPQVATVLQQAQRMQSIMDEQLHKMSNETFNATDESETVEVTLNGHHYLTGVFIKDGILRLGAHGGAATQRGAAERDGGRHRIN